MNDYFGEILNRITLNLDGKVVIRASTEVFSVRKNFGSSNSIQLSLDPNFIRLFLDRKEIQSIDTELSLFSFKAKSICHRSIIKLLGDDPLIKSSMYAAFVLLSKQPNGEDGFLLNDGRLNFWYFEDRFPLCKESWGDLERYSYVKENGVRVCLYALHASWQEKCRYWYINIDSCHTNGLHYFGNRFRVFAPTLSTKPIIW